jgi:predicted small lipoprotein YifL
MKRVLLWSVALFAVISLAACAQKGEEKKEKPAPEASKSKEAAKQEPAAKQEDAPAAEPAASTSAEPGDTTDPAAAEPAAAEPSTAEPAAAAPEQPSAKVAEADPAFDLTGPLAAVEKFVPDAPVIVAVGDAATLESIIMETMGGGLFVLPEEKMKALQETLSAYHLKNLGVTVRGVETAVAFVGPTGDSGVLVKADVQFSEKMLGEEVGGFRLLNIIPDPSVKMFQIPDYGIGIYVAAAVNLETYLQMVNERTAPKPDRLKVFSDMLAENREAFLTIAINFEHPIVAAAWPPDVPFKRPNKGLIQLTTRGLVVEIEADTEVLDSIDALVAMGRSKGREFLEQRKAQLDTLPVGEGTMAIIGDAYYDTLFERLGPKREGNRMRMELTLDLWGATPLIGILAAVAIPAFIKYTKRAKSSEANMNLQKIRSAAEVYFCTPRVDQQGNMLPNQFPASAGPTPEAGCCAALGGSDLNGDDACDDDPERFSGETWLALNFQPSGKHYYAYQFTSNGKTGNEAEFTASAFGDLDCDGIRSTFEVRGAGKVDGSNCEIDLGSAMYIENEIE